MDFRTAFNWLNVDTCSRHMKLLMCGGVKGCNPCTQPFRVIVCYNRKPFGFLDNASFLFLTDCICSFLSTMRFCNTRSGLCIRCRFVKRPVYSGCCRIPFGFAAGLPFLHGHCQKSSGCAHIFPTDKVLWKHWQQSSEPCNPACRNQGIADSFRAVGSEMRGSP